MSVPQTLCLIRQHCRDVWGTPRCLELHYKSQHLGNWAPLALVGSCSLVDVWIGAEPLDLLSLACLDSISASNWSLRWQLRCWRWHWIYPRLGETNLVGVIQDCVRFTCSDLSDSRFFCRMLWRPPGGGTFSVQVETCRSWCSQPIS